MALFGRETEETPPNLICVLFSFETVANFAGYSPVGRLTGVSFRASQRGCEMEAATTQQPSNILLAKAI